MIAPLFIHADFSKPFILEMDASNFVINTILSQLGKDNLLHPIGFHSHKFSPLKSTIRFMTKNF